MSCNWVLNMAGCRLSEDKMCNIAHPTTELVVHVTYKTVQTFSILGLGVIGPLVARYNGVKDWDGISTSSMEYGRKGALAGLVAGPLFVGARFLDPNMNRAGAYDRSYQIRCNRNQVRVDRLSTIGGITGAGSMYFTGGNTVNGLILGLSAGCLLGGVYNVMFGKKTE